MDLLERFLVDMRAKCRTNTAGGAASANTARHIMDFHTITNGAFNVNFHIMKPATAGADSRSKYAPLNGCPDARIIITSRREYQGPRTRFNVMSGVVIKYPEWKVISIMPELPQAEIDLKYIRENYDDYVAFPCRDATTATLYYDNSAWRVSTYNGLDVSDHTWLGATTYMEAIRELCAKHEAFSWDRLQKTREYTVMFHHQYFHTFMGEKPCIELVQVVDLANLGRGVILSDDIGLPHLNQCEISLDQILAKRDSSIADFRKDNENRCYGYVLRHKSTLTNPMIAAAASAASASAAAAAAADQPRQQAKNGGNKGNGSASNRSNATPQWLSATRDANACDYIIESRLMLFIRRTIYDLPRGPAAPVKLMTPDERISYYCLRAFLGKPDICTIFMILFPQYKDKYDECNTLITNLRGKLVAAIGCNGGDTATGRPKGFDPINVIAASLYDGLIQHKLNINSSQTASIIDDYIRNPDNLLMFHAYYQSTR